MKNKNFLTFVASGLSACALGLLVWAAEPQCQKPNPSTKACYDPNNRVAQCEGIGEADCTASSEANLLYVYDEIAQFPDGTVKADEGATKTESTNCWKRKKCVWNSTTHVCVTEGDWSLWRVKEKIVANPDVTCPSE